MLAALIPGRNRVIMEHSAGARFFSFNLEFRHKGEASALRAGDDEVIEWIGQLLRRMSLLWKRSGYHFRLATERAPESVAPSTNCLEVDFGARVDWGSNPAKKTPEGQI